MSDFDSAAREYVKAFNLAVRDGDFADFLAIFAEDATLEMQVDQAPLTVGRAQIAEYLTLIKPQTPMTIVNVRQAGPDTARIDFRTDLPPQTGAVEVSWRSGKITSGDCRRRPSVSPVDVTGPPVRQ